MSEFTEGVFNFLKRIIRVSSLILALIYTLGHICIAMTVVSLLTGASLWEAGLVALIEPSINGVWFYVLHSTWKKLYGHCAVFNAGCFSQTTIGKSVTVHFKYH